MKKIKVFAFALLAGLALTSCTESYLKKYESACKEGDAAKAAVYAGKLAGKELSDEQQKRLENASMELATKATEDMNLEGWE